MKRVFSLIIAVAMVACFSVTGFADENIPKEPGDNHPKFPSYYYGNGATEITIAARTDDQAGAVITFKKSEGDPKEVTVDANTIIIAGYFNSDVCADSVDTKVVMTGGTVKTIYGGGSNGAKVGTADITISGGKVTEGVYGAPKSASGSVEKSIIKISGGEIGSVAGGNAGSNDGVGITVKETDITVSGDAKITNSLTAGSINGNVDNADVTIEGGVINILQAVNRGNTGEVTFDITGGKITRFYLGVEPVADANNTTADTGTVGAISSTTISGGASIEKILPGFNANAEGSDACRFDIDKVTKLEIDPAIYEKITFDAGKVSDENCPGYSAAVEALKELAKPSVAVTGVTLNKTAMTLTVGGEETLTATVTPANATDKTVTWTSDAEAVATVANGKVTAVAKGTANIKAAVGGQEATCAVTVNEAAKPGTPSVSITADKASIKEDETATVTAEVKNTTEKVTWTVTGTTKYVDSGNPLTVTGEKDNITVKASVTVDGTDYTSDTLTITVTAKDTPATPPKEDDPGSDDPTPGPGSSSGSSSESVESPSDNAANSEATISVIEDAIVALATGAELPKAAVTATTAAGTSVTAIPVKLTSGSANILTETASLVGTGRVALDISVDNGAMEVLLPGGFGVINEPGRIYYPFNFVSNPTLGGTMRLFVKEKDAESETVKAGGNMTLPTTATVTLKTKLTGKVNIYYYNEETGRFTKLATVTPKDGKITFATKQMGHMLITTGTI